MTLLKKLDSGSMPRFSTPCVLRGRRATAVLTLPGWCCASSRRREGLSSSPATCHRNKTFVGWQRPPVLSQRCSGLAGRERTEIKRVTAETTARKDPCHLLCVTCPLSGVTSLKLVQRGCSGQAAKSTATAGTTCRATTLLAPAIVPAAGGAGAVRKVRASPPRHSLQPWAGATEAPPRAWAGGRLCFQ